MDLSPGKRRALFLATAWLPFYVALFMCVGVSITFATSLRASSGGDPAWMPAVMAVIMPIHFLTILESLVVTGVYVYLVMTRYVGDETERIGWLLAVLLAGFVGQLVFFWTKLRPQPRARGVGAGSG